MTARRILPQTRADRPRCLSGWDLRGADDARRSTGDSAADRGNRGQERDAPGAREVVREKVSSIAAWTDILFSDRKRTYGGDEEVTELLLHDCERLRAAIRGD